MPHSSLKTDEHVVFVDNQANGHKNMNYEVNESSGTELSSGQSMVNGAIKNTLIDNIIKPANFTLNS